MAKRLKKILITGAQGFIGSVLSQKLITAFKNKYEIIGTDIGYFKSCKIYNFKDPIKIIKSDIRSLNEHHLENVYAVVHLAALSNDPLGNFNKNLTYDINVKATERLAKIARRKNVSKFIFSSSCIMYGASSNKKVDETCKLQPITQYAKSKVLAEKKLRKLATKNFAPIFLRNGTIYGLSPRMRLDTVLNDFTAQAYCNSNIKIYGNGLPYRPVVHVDDVCRIIIKFIEEQTKKIHNEAFNIGDEKLNYQILQLAKDVCKAVPKTQLIIQRKNDADYRTYLASFKKLKKIFPSFKFKKTPVMASKEIFKFFKSKKINKSIYIDKKFVRLSHLEKKYPNLLKRGK